MDEPETYGENRHLYDGCHVRFSDDAAWDESDFDGDILSSDLTSQPEWNDLSGRLGIVEEKVEMQDQSGEWIFYNVRLPCGSLIGVMGTWLLPLSPIEQLARAISEDGK